MADSVYTRVLAQAAAELEGGAPGLAKTLRVPQDTLARWMDGKAPMPVQAFLKVISLVSEREGAGHGAAGRDTLSFPMGRLLARCARCDSTKFVPVEPEAPLRMTSELACVECGENVIHGNLIARLGAETVQQARAMAVARARRQINLGGRKKLVR
jgi:hypothetical protein